MGPVTLACLQQGKVFFSYGKLAGCANNISPGFLDLLAITIKNF
jgi:hypothetical protein